MRVRYTSNYIDLSVTDEFFNKSNRVSGVLNYNPGTFDNFLDISQVVKTIERLADFQRRLSVLFFIEMEKNVGTEFLLVCNNYSLLVFLFQRRRWNINDF